MNIIINATPVFSDRAIRRYTYHLIQQLSEIDVQNNYFIFYIAFHREHLGKILSLNNPRFKTVVCSLPGKIIVPLWNSIHFPWVELLTGMGADIFHATDFDIAATKKAKGIFTLHGVSYAEAPQWFPPAFVEHSKKRLDIAIKKCSHFIAVSETTKQQFLEYSKLHEQRVSVVHLGVGDDFYPFEDKTRAREEIKTKFNITKPYILYVGAIEKWKNVEGIVDAFRIVKWGKHSDHVLVLAGERGFIFDELREKTNKYGLSKDVCYTGSISQHTQDLLCLYNCADVFVFPSFVEGFTSPPLEAMKCGCPVVTSNVSSLPETVGSAALTVNPHSPEEIAAAMQRVLSNTEIRKELIHKGIQHVKQFTWERVAKETLVVYRKVYENLY